MPRSKTPSLKNPAAVALGRLGGLKGGRAVAGKRTAEERIAIARKGAEARSKKLTPEERRRIAQKAVRARWAKRSQES